jgi:hypothetical protein
MVNFYPIMDWARKKPTGILDKVMQRRKGVGLDGTVVNLLGNNQQTERRLALHFTQSRVFPS